MPPIIALLLNAAFVLFLLRFEKNKELNVSAALWIPIIWMILSGSRFVSQWLNPYGAGGSIEEGSPIDRAVFFGLIIGGVLVLSRRKLPWSQIIRQNLSLILFLGYCGISITWSDFPFVSFKRWIKEIGNLVMVLVILSEPDYVEAIKTVLKKLSYVLVPLSIVLIKYFPEYGRGFSEWTGEAYNRGVGLNKNYLGLLCLISGFFFLWCLSGARRSKAARLGSRIELFVEVLILLMIFWLFDKAHCATALVSFIAGACVLLGLKVPIFKSNLKSIGAIATMACITIFFLQVSFNLDEVVIRATGRDSSLTDRVPLWRNIIALRTDPVVGSGYNSFWLGKEAKELSEKLWWHPNSTHNGFLDTYVNLGWTGVFLLAGLIFSSFKKAKNELISNFEYGRYRMGWLVVVLLYNLTETAFGGVNLIWLIFLLIAVDYPRTVVKDHSFIQ